MTIVSPPSSVAALQTPQQLLPSSATSPQLPLDDIQGDVIIGLQKKWQRFVFFTISPNNLAGFKAALRGPILKAVTTAERAREREGELRDHKLAVAAGSVPPSGLLVPMIGLNIAFTHSGLTKLLPGASIDGPGMQALSKTPADIARACGDAMNGNAPAEWDQAFLNAQIDGVLLITGASRDEVEGAWAKLQVEIGPVVTEAWVEGALGNVRPEPNVGHEHFGWQDGISQPAVKGIADPFPGQDLIPPGLFVFGQEGSPPAPSPWMANGSLMVFRKLAQAVPEFDQFLRDDGDKLGMDPALLGARMMGRWKSGAPLALAPLQDDVALGGRADRNNDFDFSNDAAQRRCPFGSHIRKTNPRSDLPGQVQAHRIMRAGIPYGPEVSESPAAERGLLFVCYQTSIENQFEFVQGSWSNNPSFVFGKVRPPTPAAVSNGPALAPPFPPFAPQVLVGHDPIIGQAGGSPRFMDEPVPNYPTGQQRSTLQLARQFVTPRAGIYLFVPSVSAMESTLST